jgi:hypothetical protein
VSDGNAPPIKGDAMRVVTRTAVLVAVVGLMLLGLSTVASAAQNPVGSAKWCKNHPASKLPACKNGGGGGTGGPPPPPPTITVTVDPNGTSSLVETGNSEIYAVVEVETSPSLSNAIVDINSQQLANSCGGAILFGSLQPTAVYSPDSVEVHVDADGNATVSLYGIDCAPGADLIEADLIAAPYYTAIGTLNVGPPNVTPAGVTGYPADEVETGNTGPSGLSDVYSVFYLETDPVYAELNVQIDSPQLFNRCLGGITWISNQGSFSTFLASATLDNDGNAVFAFTGAECGPGDSTVIGEVDAGNHPSYSTVYTIEGPTPTI